MIISLLRNKSLLISILTILITVSLQLIFIRYASYSIEKIDYGNFILIQTLLSGLMLLFLQMPIQSFDRFYNQSTNKESIINEFKTIVLFLSGMSIFTIMLYGIILEKFSNELLLIVYFLFMLISYFAITQRIFLLKIERKKYLYFRIFEALSKFLLPIIFYIYFTSLKSLLLGMTIGYTISLIILSLYTQEYSIKYQINWDNLKKYLIYSYPIFFFSIFNWGITFSDRYFIEYFLSTEDLAIYGLLGMAAAIRQIFGQIYSIYVEPIILKLYETNKEEAYIQLNKYLLILLSVFIVLIIIFLILPKSIYTVLLEPKLVYDSYYFQTMLLLIITIFIGVLHTAHHMYFKLLKKLNILAYIYLIALFINLFGNLYILDYGIIAASISTLISYLVILTCQSIYISSILRKK